MKTPGEHARLARAFDVPQTRTGIMVGATSGAALIGLLSPLGLVIAGGLVVGAGGIVFDDRRKVANGLREVERFGFPVLGYRAWLLADEPTFEIELVRNVELDVLITSARAIDDSIQVTRTRDRTFRVVTRRVALPSLRKKGAAVLVGDRQLLAKLHAQLLAPLHADVGIQRMNMGGADLPALPPLLPAPSDAGTHEVGAFRVQAMAAPPALQALVESDDREMPREARKLSYRAERVVYATGASPHSVGTVLGFTVGGAITGTGWFELIGMGLGAVGGLVAGTVAAINGNRRNAHRVASSVLGHGFPIEGYDDWLISGRPLLDIQLTHAIERAWLVTMLERLPRAFSISANADVPWVTEVKWLDDQLVRIETRPALIEPDSARIAPFYGGSHSMFEKFLHEVLAPLHAHAGIAVVRMGGYIDRRV